jgi:hypothetical protein
VIAQANAEEVVRFTGFLGDLRFTASEVRADLVGSDSDLRQVAIAMEGTAADQFALFTATHVNQTVNLFVCGQPVLTARLQAQVLDGFAISDPIDLDLATEMVDALNGLQDCPS